MVKVRAIQIFTRIVEDAVAAKKELDDNIPFAQVVEKYSQCPSKKSGGDLGWMPEENLEGLFGVQLTEADVGKVIGPIHSQYGYHILVLSEIRLPETHTLLFQKLNIGMPVFGYKPEETLETVCCEQQKPLATVIIFLNEEYQKKNMGSMTCEDLSGKLRRKEPLQVLDIRESWERDIACIPESTLITSENSERILSSLALEAEIVIVDWKGERGSSFQGWLSNRGFANVKCLQGGIDAWADKIDTRMSRYDIDEDDDYRYEDIIPEENPD